MKEPKLESTINTSIIPKVSLFLKRVFQEHYVVTKIQKFFKFLRTYSVSTNLILSSINFAIVKIVRTKIHSFCRDGG